MIKKMKLAWITVNDFERSQKFFSETLGLSIDACAPEYGWMELKGSEGGMMLGVGQASPHNPEGCNDQPGQNAIMTMTVDDLDAAMAVYQNKGLTFTGTVLEIPGHVKMVRFADPDGNQFQLVQELDA
ncbi:MAG: VOC family protein [Pseudomonadota bacterium]